MVARGAGGPDGSGPGDAPTGASAAATRLAPHVHSLVTDHLALVGHIARETASRLPRHLGTDDLVGAGALALVQAAHAFDASLGVPFARFANTRIRGAMIDQMRQRDWASRSVRARARALAAAAEQLTAALGREPQDAELAAAAGLTEAELREARHGADRASLLTLDPLAADDGGLGGSLADPALQPDDALIAAERLGYVRDAIAELPDRLRSVVTAYYLEQRPLTEIAEELGVTQSRASQLRAEGLSLLREALQALLGDDARAGAGALERIPAQRGRGLPVTDAAGGVRARRREAYVNAVAKRSANGRRADVQGFLNGSTFHESVL